MWKTVTLGASCKMYQPKTISAKEMVADGEYVVFGANGIIGKYNQYNHAEPQLLVTCRGATCGAVNVSQPFSWINGNAMVIQPDLTNISLKYMEYLFRGGIDLTKAITGAAQPQITRQSLEPIEFSYPPLAEQQRIVAKLDAAFTEIDISIATIKAKELQIQNLTSNLTSHVISSKGLNAVKLGDVCKLIGGGTPSKRNPEYYKGNIPWATVRDMHSDKLIDTELSITDEGLKNSSSKVIKSGNIIIASRVGLGKVCLLNQDTAINQDLKGVVPFDDKILDSNYLFYWFKSVANTIISAGRGATVQGVSLPFLQALPLNLPSLQEQKYMVTKLDSASKDIKILKALLNKSKENYQALKSAILKQELQSEAA